MTSHLMISVAMIMALTGSNMVTLPVMALDNNSSKVITIQDKYGNTQGSIKRIGNMSYESDKYGNTVRTYKQIGNIIYIYDKYNNCVGSFRK